MSELGRRPDEPGESDGPAHRSAWRDREFGPARALIEPRSREQYTAELRALTTPRDRPDQPPAGMRPRPVDQPRTADRTPTATRDRPEQSAAPDLAALRRFRPERAGLPHLSGARARQYIESRHTDRPWLAAAGGRPAEVQRVFAALDHGGGHAHQRHEGWPTERMTERRVRYLEDPAQTDPAKRERAIDGSKPGDRPHTCGGIAGRIADPDTFAVAFARGIEHPQVRAALDRPFDPHGRPMDVSVPIVDLLGPDGHRHCTGWRLDPVGGSMDAARDCRAAWVDAQVRDRDPDVPEPRARRVETFEGGTINFFFRANAARTGYEVVTMYPSPPGA